MLFTNFLTLAHPGDLTLPVKFSVLRNIVHAHHHGINVVKLYPIDFGEHGQETAHYVLKDDEDMRESPHEQECFNAEIRFCKNLRDDLHLFNFVMTKELMHVFDASAARVDTREKFLQLLMDAESRPAPGIATSDEFRAEIVAYWRALVALCPKTRRDELKIQYTAGEVSRFDVAEEFLIPDDYVPAVMGSNFDDAYAAIVT